jgi:hypothetical protein
VLDHQPYSPDLSLFDFHVLSPLKKMLKGKKFMSNEQVQTPVEQWLQKQSSDISVEGINWLICQWMLAETPRTTFNSHYSLTQNNPESFPFE